jgi:hypothetical protein
MRKPSGLNQPLCPRRREPPTSRKDNQPLYAGPNTRCCILAQLLSDAIGARIALVDYRLIPEASRRVTGRGFVSYGHRLPCAGAHV